MSILKQKNWPVSLILMLTVSDVYVVLLAYAMNLIDKKAWYTKWQYWFFGALCLIFPVFIMMIIFVLQMLVSVSKKLNVPGVELYGTPYIWILCLIVPVIGWIFLFVMYIYLNVWIVVSLYRGEGEKNIA